ncbi:site-specific DNA-methyltransferase [Streptomyces sp. NBRC 109706]|uniref:DNA-methyltransferase n=1 Tax=Streptomyces sp. NBRC 109706 TaxID=1550035 RepID=UPI000783CD64|nr:site-specific DNA-methyltransferase [Streptomyces sp. NBRC 109706]
MTPPYFDRHRITLYTGDAVDVLAQLRDGSADCVVTSPPYWGLRDYGTGTWTGGDPACPHVLGGSPRVCRRCGAARHDQQCGLEPTLNDYIDNLRRVFAQLHRVLSDTGTLWLNLADSYSTTPPGRTAEPMGTSTLTSRASARRLRDSVRHAAVDRTGELPQKNLHGLPWRVAFALQRDGWILRNAVVWHKPNAMPQSVTDRLSCRYELLFLLVKQRHYFFDLDAIREPLARAEAQGVDAGRRAHAGHSARRRSSAREAAKYTDTGSFIERPGAGLRPTGRKHTSVHPRGKNPGDVWTLPTRPLKAAHFAAFPVDIPLRCIAAGCPEDGVVLDPFSGSGTTGLAARQLRRSYVGIDLRDDFHAIALDRLGLSRSDAHCDRTERPE